MPKLIERSDRAQAAADVGTASSVWSERIFGDAGESFGVLPERGSYQVILLKIDSTSTEEKPRCKSALDMIGYGAKFHKLRTTEEWMKELREGDDFRSLYPTLKIYNPAKTDI